MHYYCPNNRCARYATVEKSDTHVSPVCPRCGYVTIPMEDDRLAGRVIFLGLVGGVIGFAASGALATAVIGTIAGAFLGAVTYGWWG